MTTEQLLVDMYNDIMQTLKLKFEEQNKILDDHQKDNEVEPMMIFQFYHQLAVNIPVGMILSMITQFYTNEVLIEKVLPDIFNEVTEGVKKNLPKIIIA